jgi:hypothetical protein
METFFSTWEELNFAFLLELGNQNKEEQEMEAEKINTTEKSKL